MQLNLLVLRCKNIEKSKEFYEKLGLKFIKEQHGKSPVHYSTYVGKMLMELYPLKDSFEIEQSRLGFSVEKSVLGKMKNDIILEYEFDGQRVVVIVDPDGRKIELRKEEKCSN